MIKDLLPYFEREQRNLSLLIDEFALQYPQLAAAAGIVDGVCKDPEAARVIEAMTMLGARILKQLEDGYPQFTEALLSMNYPHYTQPFPSTSITRFDYSISDARTMDAVLTLPRHTPLHSIDSDGEVCHFRTAYPVTIAPLTLSRVWFDAVCQLPPGMVARQDAPSMLHITIEGKCASRSLGQLGLQSVRLFIEGEPSLRATLRDLLFMRVVTAYLEVEGRPGWIGLSAIPVKAAGFDDDDALITHSANAHPAYRIITEYFACPEKFNFLDIDFATLSRHLPEDGQSMTLHLAVAGVAAQSDMARILAALSNKNLLLACTPVINLFKHAAVPIRLTHTTTESTLLPSARNAHAYDVHSVDLVQLTRSSGAGSVTDEVHPYFSWRHGRAGKNGRFWLKWRDDTLAQCHPGYEWQFSLVDSECNPLVPAASSLSIELTCTNRDLPAALRVGAPLGDLKLDRAAGRHPIRLLRKPTPSYRFPAKAQWRLVSLLAMNQRTLVHENLEAFTEMLALYNLPRSAVSERQIRGIVGLSQKPARAWIRDRHGSCRVHGVEVTLTVEEAAFVGSGLHVFVQVIDHFLAMYAHLNTFTQLTVISKETGRELIRCLPRNGQLTLA